MWNIVPTNYSDKTTPIAWDKAWGYDSVWIANVNFTMSSIATYVIWAKTTTDLSEWTNLYYTDARFDTRFSTKDTDDISEGTTNKYASTANVNAAWATMNTDTTLVWNSYFLDEDTMSSDDATKVPSQQSVKAYVDSKLLLSEILSVWTLTFDDVSQTDITINHNLWVTPKKMEFIFPESTIVRRIWVWADNNGTKTSYTRFNDTTHNRVVTSSEAIATYNDSNNSNWEWRVSSVSTTQVVLTYAIVFDWWSWAPTTETWVYVTLTT